MTGLGNADDVYKHYLKVIEENKQLKKKLEIAVEAMKLARDTSYSSTQDCPKCAFIDEKLSEALTKIKEIK